MWFVRISKHISIEIFLICVKTVIYKYIQIKKTAMGFAERFNRTYKLEFYYKKWFLFHIDKKSFVYIKTPTKDLFEVKIFSRFRIFYKCNWGQPYVGQLIISNGSLTNFIEVIGICINSFFIKFICVFITDVY